jgi:4-hydroxy-4-methyl-2-oxoglutarate aldolase
VLDLGIRALVGGAFAGPALTVETHDDPVPVLIALGEARPGDVLVVVTNPGSRAILGEIFTAEARRRGVVGIVIDGRCRDLAGLRELGLPVHGRGTDPGTGTLVGGPSHGRPVICGGVLVRPGDIVVGDDDGVVVIPPDRVDAVAERAGEIVRGEAAVLAAIAAGTPLHDLTNVAEHVAALARGEASRLGAYMRGSSDGVPVIAPRAPSAPRAPTPARPER